MWKRRVELWPLLLLGACLAMGASGALSRAVDAHAAPRIDNVATQSEASYPWSDAPCEWGAAGGSDCHNPRKPADAYHWGLIDATGFHPYDQWGYEYRNCTSYVAWRLSQDGKTGFSQLGSASEWVKRAETRSGVVVSTTPTVGSVAVWTNGDHVAYVESTTGGTIEVSDFNGLMNGKYAGPHPASRVFKKGTMPDHYLRFPTSADALRSSALGKVITVGENGTSYYYDGTLHWIPERETYYCLIAHGKQVITVQHQAQVDRLGSGKPWVSPCFDPARVIGHIVREAGGTAYYVTSGGPLAAGGTLWHWIPDGATYNCLLASGVTVISSNWTQINTLRGSNGQNEGPQAICSTGGGAPTITSIADLTISHTDTGSYRVRVDYRDDDCDVVGGTWIDPSGVSHDFGNGSGSNASYPGGCTGGIGYLTPGYGSCTGPDGRRGTPGRYAQTITIKDKLGHVSAPFVFYIICQ